MSKTIDQGEPNAIPQQGKRHLRGIFAFPLPCGLLSTAENPQEYVAFGRRNHGCARSIESMRRVRLLVVPLST